jgi:hypothetical protein
MNVGMVSSGSVQDVDKVDGFHASQTPAPNVIVPLNSNGILDLSATYVKSNVYTFRRVDLTNATSDYEVQVGEEAIRIFNNQQLVPLRVAIQEPSNPLNPVIYNIAICIYQCSVNNLELVFYPNNTTYSGQIINTFARGGDSGWVFVSETFDTFRFDTYYGTDYPPFFCNFYAIYYGTSQQKLLHGTFITKASVGVYSWIWNNTLTAWTSLGTFKMRSDTTTNISGIAFVRRLA